MSKRKLIEVYSAGCGCCHETIEMVRRIAGNLHDVETLDMHRPHIAAQAARLGIHHVPAVMVDGELAACCEGRGCDESVLRLALY